MDTLSMNRKNVLELGAHAADQCLSFFLPTHRKGHEVDMGVDRLILKNQC